MLMTLSATQHIHYYIKQCYDMLMTLSVTLLSDSWKFRLELVIFSHFLILHAHITGEFINKQT